MKKMNETLTPEQVATLAQLAAEECRKHKDVRLGQALMNALHQISPASYVDVTQNPECDPFYNDENFPAFWSYVA